MLRAFCSSSLLLSSGELGRYSLTNAYNSKKVELTFVNKRTVEVQSPTMLINNTVPNDSNFLVSWLLALLERSAIIKAVPTHRIGIIGMKYGKRTWPTTEKKSRSGIIHNMNKISLLINPT